MVLIYVLMITPKESTKKITNTHKVLHENTPI